MTLREVAEQAATIYEEYLEDGDFSGPASAEACQRAIEEVAKANGFTYDQVETELLVLSNEWVDADEGRGR